MAWGGKEPGWRTQAQGCALSSSLTGQQALLVPTQTSAKSRSKGQSPAEAKRRERGTHESPHRFILSPHPCGLMGRREESDSGCSFPRDTPPPPSAETGADEMLTPEIQEGFCTSLRLPWFPPLSVFSDPNIRCWGSPRCSFS